MSYDPYAPSQKSPRKPAVSRVSEEVWDRARQAYLAGESGPSVCERYGIGLTTFRERASHDGWRRVDMKESTLTSGREVLPASAAYTDMAAEAGMRLREALARGRAADVVSWMRVQDQLADRIGQDTTAFQQAQRASPHGTGGMRAIHATLDQLVREARDADPAYNDDLAAALADLAEMSRTIDEIEAGAEPGLRSS